MTKLPQTNTKNTSETLVSDVLRASEFSWIEEKENQFTWIEDDLVNIVQSRLDAGHSVDDTKALLLAVGECVDYNLYTRHVQSLHAIQDVLSTVNNRSGWTAKELKEYFIPETRADYDNHLTQG